MAGIGAKLVTGWISTGGYSMTDGHLVIRKFMIILSHWKHHSLNFRTTNMVATGRLE